MGIAQRKYGAEIDGRMFMGQVTMPQSEAEPDWWFRCAVVKAVAAIASLPVHVVAEEVRIWWI